MEDYWFFERIILVPPFRYMFLFSRGEIHIFFVQLRYKLIVFFFVVTLTNYFHCHTLRAAFARVCQCAPNPRSHANKGTYSVFRRSVSVPCSTLGRRPCTHRYIFSFCRISVFVLCFFQLCQLSKKVYAEPVNDGSANVDATR